MESNQEKKSGVLLVGHGTRNDRGVAEFFELARLIQDLLPDFVLQTSFLELVSPDMSSGIDHLMSQGVQEIIVVPVLLFAAGHAKRDIPLAIEQARRRHPGVRWSCTGPLAEHAQVLQVSERRLLDAIHAADLSINGLTLLMVGRGSLDDTATGAMHRYASFLTNRLKIRRYRVAFLAMAEPNFATVLNELAGTDGGPVIVQPHLLFQGDLLEQVQTQVQAINDRSNRPRFVLTNHLGATAELAEVFAELVRTEQARGQVIH